MLLVSVLLSGKKDSAQAATRQLNIFRQTSAVTQVCVTRLHGWFLFISGLIQLSTAWLHLSAFLIIITDCDLMKPLAIFSLQKTVYHRCAFTGTAECHKTWLYVMNHVWPFVVCFSNNALLQANTMCVHRYMYVCMYVCILGLWLTVGSFQGLGKVELMKDVWFVRTHLRSCLFLSRLERKIVSWPEAAATLCLTAKMSHFQKTGVAIGGAWPHSTGAEQGHSSRAVLILCFHFRNETDVSAFIIS